MHFIGSEYLGSGKDGQDLWVFQKATPQFCMISGLWVSDPLALRQGLLTHSSTWGRYLRLDGVRHSKKEAKAFQLSVVMHQCGHIT